MKQILRFLYAIPKSYRLAKQCKSSNCLSVFEFHIWRIYKLEVEQKLMPKQE